MCRNDQDEKEYITINLLLFRLTGERVFTPGRLVGSKGRRRNLRFEAKVARYRQANAGTVTTFASVPKTRPARGFQRCAESRITGHAVRHGPLHLERLDCHQPVSGNQEQDLHHHRYHRQSLVACNQRLAAARAGDAMTDNGDEAQPGKQQSHP